MQCATVALSGLSPSAALSLFLEVQTATDGGLSVLRRRHARTTIVNRNATTYAAFGADPAPDAVRARALLARLAGERLTEDPDTAVQLVEMALLCSTAVARRGSLSWPQQLASSRPKAAGLTLAPAGRGVFGAHRGHDDRVQRLLR